MIDEPNGGSGVWTVPALKEHLESQIAELDRRVREEALALREHIILQIGQISAAVERAESDTRLAQDASERLELERIASVDQRMDIMITDLAARVTAGDTQLKEHIAAQVGQIAAALDAARREADVALAANEKAINKADVATEKRFDAVNEFRNSLADQTASFLPREVAEAQFEQFRRSIGELTDKLSKIT